MDGSRLFPFPSPLVRLRNGDILLFIRQILLKLPFLKLGFPCSCAG
jgi:hypothetical protein